MIRKYCISDTDRLIDALDRLNRLHSVAMTLFVIDGGGRMVGSLTDGDLRRALLAGAGLQDPVTRAANRSFISVAGRSEAAKIRELRRRGILLVPVLDGDARLVDIIDLSSSRAALPVDAVLMAGGKGERLRPLTLNCPKPLLEIGDKAIIDRNIGRLIDNGIKDISVTVNYLKERFFEHFEKPVAPGVTVSCVAEKEFYGTIGALRLVREFHNDTILVMNSDLLTDIDYEDMYIHFRENGAMMSAAAVPYTVSIPYGIFDLDGREIRGVEEKPVYNLYANAGIYMLRKEALRFIPDGVVFNATDLIETLVANGERVIRYPLTGLWIDIGTPDEFRRAGELVRHLK